MQDSASKRWGLAADLRMSVSVVRRVLDRYGTEGEKDGKDGVTDEAGMRMRRGHSMFTKLMTRQ